jgi:hypothetical protein
MLLIMNLYDLEIHVFCVKLYCHVQCAGSKLEWRSHVCVAHLLPAFGQSLYMSIIIYWNMFQWIVTILFMD